MNRLLFVLPLIALAGARLASGDAGDEVIRAPAGGSEIVIKATALDAAYADALNATIKPEQLKEWQAGTPTDWADESHKVAADVAYAGIPADGL